MAVEARALASTLLGRPSVDRPAFDCWHLVGHRNTRRERGPQRDELFTRPPRSAACCTAASSKQVRVIAESREASLLQRITRIDRPLLSPRRRSLARRNRLGELCNGTRARLWASSAAVGRDVDALVPDRQSRSRARRRSLCGVKRASRNRQSSDLRGPPGAPSENGARGSFWYEASLEARANAQLGRRCRARSGGYSWAPVFDQLSTIVKWSVCAFDAPARSVAANTAR
jgi:hypothetical protein